MNNADSMAIDLIVQGLRLFAYLALLIAAMIGIFGSMSMLSDNKRLIWHRWRSGLVYTGLAVTVVQGVTSLLNIGLRQGWSAAFIPFTTYGGRLSNGFALIALYITLAYIIPTLIVRKRHGQQLPSRFLSVLLFPVLELLLLSGMLIRNYAGLLPMRLIYVFTAVCLIWLLVLKWISSEGKERQEREEQRYRWRSPDIKLTHRATEEPKHEEDPPPLPR